MEVESSQPPIPHRRLSGAWHRGPRSSNMTVTSIIVAGIEIPSRDPAFLAVVAVHVLFGLAGAITGATAMVSPKRSRRHPWVGTVYYRCLTGGFVTGGALCLFRCVE